MISFLDRPSAVRRVDVGDGGLVPAHAHDDASVERGVGLAVAAAVEAVASVGLAGPGRDGTGAAHLRERRFGADPVGVVAGGDEELAGDVGADPERLDQFGAAAVVRVLSWRLWTLISSCSSSQRRASDAEHVTHGVVRIGQVAVAASAAQAVMSLKSLSGSSSTRSSSAAVTRVAFNVIMAVVWAFTAVSRTILTSRIDSTLPLALFGVAETLPASTSLAACSSVDEVALARQAPFALARRPAHLDHLVTVAPQEPGQTDPVGAAPSTPNATTRPSPRRPGEQLAIALVGRGRSLVVEVTAEPVEERQRRVGPCGCRRRR